MMPGFGATMSDADIAALAAYLRASRSKLAPWPELQSKVAALRQAGKQASANPANAVDSVNAKNTINAKHTVNAAYPAGQP